MNCIPILNSNTCTSVSCGYHTWCKFHFFGHSLLGLWWETGNIQKNYSFGHTVYNHTKLQFWTYCLHSHKITVLDILFTLTQQNQPQSQCSVLTRSVTLSTSWYKKLQLLSKCCSLNDPFLIILFGIFPFKSMKNFNIWKHITSL